METKLYKKKTNLKIATLGLLLASVVVSSLAVSFNAASAQLTKNINTNNLNLQQKGNNEKACGVNSGQDKETNDDVICHK